MSRFTAREIVLALFVTLFNTFIITIVTNNDLTIFFSINTVSSYFSWLIIESILIAIFFYGLFYLWNLRMLLGIGEKPSEKLFKVSRFIKTKRIVYYFLPSILGIIYFFVYDDLIYRFNKSSDEEIGVLVADFREVALTDYIAQKTYSEFLKEEFPQYDFKCMKNAPIKFKSTSAFFTSIEEATNYGAKIGAKLVVWGEVSKTKGVIRINAKVAYPFDFGWSIAEKEFPDIYMYESFNEDWELSGSPLILKIYLVFWRNFWYFQP